jgi:hypothetical protein
MTDAARNNVVSFEEWLSGKPAQPRPAPATVVPFTGNADAYARKAIDEECAILSTTTEGSRNHQLNVAAFKLASIVDAGRADRDTTIAALADAARRCGLAESEIMPTINSAFRGSAAKVGARVIPELEPIAPASVLDPEDFTGGGSGKVGDSAGSGTRGNTEQPPADVHRDSEVRPSREHKRTTPDFIDAENGFWDTRQSLRTIYDTALARMCSPWAVLAHCTARALTQVPPSIVLPPLIGGPGSLNWFAAVATMSGGGKGAASAVARALVTHPVTTRNLGSGEGLIDAYRPASDSDEDHEPVDRIMFLADEIDTVTALGSRTGSTLMGILRSGFSGETLGFTYRGRSTHLVEHTYRMTLVVSVQPARGGALLGDAGGGTPQRFMWFPGTDPRISLEHADEFDTTNGLTLPSWSTWNDTTLTIPDEARRWLLELRVKAARGEIDALDGHAAFCREKFAYALAILDGRPDMNSDDWRLSGIAADISTITRQWVTAGAAMAADDEAAERGRLRGVEATATDEEKADRAAKRTQRIGRLVLAKLADGPMAEPDLRRGITSRDRSWLPAALQALQLASLVGIDDQKRWVKL